MKPEFTEAAKSTRLPMFFARDDAGIFNDNADGTRVLTRQDLVRGFKLVNQDLNIDDVPVSLDLYEVDVRAGPSGGSRPEYRRLNEKQSAEFARFIEHLSEADRKRELVAILRNAFRRFDELPDADVNEYVARVVDAQDPERLAEMISNPYRYADLLKLKVITLMTEYAVKTFGRRAADNTLLSLPHWSFPPAIRVESPIDGLRNSLYTKESEVNYFELQIANHIASMDNVLFWHRNLERTGFCLNGYINHYPDFIAVTRKRNVLVVESKGDDRHNEDSTRKLKLGLEWEKKSGPQFKYFMVYQTLSVEGAFPMNQFAAVAGKL